VNSRFTPVDGAPYVAWWQEQFATPSATFDDCSFWQRGHANVWVASATVDPGAVTPVEGIGIPFLRLGAELWKPTSAAVVEFGMHATRNVMDLGHDEMLRFLDRRDIEIADDDCRVEGPRRGFVIVRFSGLAIGCGLWRRGVLESSVPKGRRMAELDLPIRR
jgi:NOL1/NOP2/fmu family ribosome biogenesis protein